MYGEMLAEIWPFPIGVAVAGVSLRPMGFTTVTKNVLFAVCGAGLESVAVTVKLKPPVAVGVPLSCPLFGSNELNPVGAVPEVVTKW